MDLRSLRMIIKMKDSEFDGNLNFGVVELSLDGKKYPLDIVETVGYDDKNQCVLMCRFEDDIELLKETFSSEMFDYSYDFNSISATEAFSAETNLEIDCESGVEKNLERIISMELHELDSQGGNNKLCDIKNNPEL